MDKGGVSQDKQDHHGAPKNAGVSTINKAVFSMRWLQLPMLVGLFLSVLIFQYHFFGHLLSMFDFNGNVSREMAILTILDLADMVLIANLILMVIISGYKIFLSPLRLAQDNSLPTWIRELTLAGLKFRIAATVLLISTIHLLHEVLDPKLQDWSKAGFLLATQLVLILTSAVFAWQDRMER